MAVLSTYLLCYTTFWSIILLLIGSVIITCVLLIADDPSLKTPISKKDRRKKKKRRGKKGQQEDSSDEEVIAPRPTVDTAVEELPEGVDLSDEDRKKKKKKGAVAAVVKDERFNALDQNLDAWVSCLLYLFTQAFYGGQVSGLV